MTYSLSRHSPERDRARRMSYRFLIILAVLVLVGFVPAVLAMWFQHTAKRREQLPGFPVVPGDQQDMPDKR